MSEKNPPAKRRFYQNILDAYRLTARTYPALPWMLLGTAALVIVLFLLLAFLTNTSWIGWLVVGIMGSITAALALLSFLARRALYSSGASWADRALSSSPRAPHLAFALS